MKKLITGLLLGTILIGLFSIWSISFASAYPPHRLNNDLNVLIQSNNATLCNVTKLETPTELITFNGGMTKDATSFNYTIDGDNFSRLGIHCVYISCTDGSTFEVGSVCRDVTPNGEEATVGKSISHMVIFFVLFVFFLITLIGIFKVEHYISKFVLYWVTHFLGIAITFIAWTSAYTILTDAPFLTAFFKTLFWIAMISVVPMMFLSLAWILYIHTVCKEMKALMERGDVEEAFQMKDNKDGWRL